MISYEDNTVATDAAYVRAPKGEVARLELGTKHPSIPENMTLERGRSEVTAI